MPYVWDFLISLGLGLWLAGGVDLGGHRILRHGADPRRMAIALLLLGWFLFPAWRKRSLWLRLVARIRDQLESARARWALIGAVSCLAAGLGIAQSRALRYPLFDVGIFQQIVWNIAHGRGFLSTISGAGNFLYDHLSLSLAIITPVAWLLGSPPWLLPALHPFLLFGGVAAWVWLAERLPGVPKPADRNRLAIATLLLGLSFDSLWGNLRWGFHETSLYFFAFSWALALLWAGPQPVPRRRFGLGCLALLVAALSKETGLLDAAIAAVLLAVSSRENRARRRGLALLATLFFVAFAAYAEKPIVADKNYFARYYAYLGTDAPGAFQALLRAPQRVWQVIGASAILRYLGMLGLPWLFFLPFYAGKKRVPWILVALPSVASAALATYPTLRSSGFHYVLEIWPVLAVLSLAGLARLPRAGWPAHLVWLWAGLGLFWWDQDPWAQLREYVRLADARTELRQNLESIPPEDSVGLDDEIGSWIAGRTRIYRWPEPWNSQKTCPDWVVIRKSMRPPPCPAPLHRVWISGDWVAYHL